MNDWQIESEPDVERHEDGRVSRELWVLPAEEAFLEAFLRDVFESHWDGVVFGPLIEGAAYEWKCPSKPRSVTLFDAYLTVHFGKGGHFHLCIGDNKGSESHPTPADLRERRKPSKAQIFRRFDRHGHPISWGFEMENGHGEPMVTIFFPSPFLTDDDGIPEAPDFTRLATWRAIARKWLDREAEALDETGRGYATA